MLNNQEFFDELSVQYDSMIPFEKAIERKKELFKNYGKSEFDTGSSEGQIALFTYRIKHLTEHLKKNKKDKIEK